jgi:hypothetical protein
MALPSHQNLRGVLHEQHPDAYRVLNWLDRGSPQFAELSFLVDAFAETDEAGFPGREHKTGEHYPEIETFLSDIQDQLTRIDPEYTPAYLANATYQERDLLAKIAREQVHKRVALESVRQHYLEWLSEFGARQHRTDAIPVDLHLDEPEFIAQRTSASSVEASQACMNACFRMVFKAVTGEMLSENYVIKALQATQGSHLVHDSTYWKVFNTPAFKQRYPQRPQVISVLGASLMDMARISGTAKSKLPGVQAYGVVSLLSESAQKTIPLEDDEPLVLKNVLHKNIVLETGWVNNMDQPRLRVHDPSPMYGRDARPLKYEEFYPRWAAALNVAHIVINRPVGPGAR